MAYRDDELAERARADALAEEVEQLRKERDELIATKKLRDRDKPANATPSDNTEPVERTDGDERPSGGAKIIGGIVVVALLGIPATVIREEIMHDKQRAAYDAAVARRDAAAKRWAATVATEPCTREIALDELLARQLMASGGYRKPFASATLERLAGRCLSSPTALVTDPATSPKVKSALNAWLAAEARLHEPAKVFGEYFAHDDWKDDDYRSGEQQWKALVPLLDERAAALAIVARDALPELRDEIRAHRGTGDVAARVEMGLRLRDVSARAESVARSPGDTTATALLLASARTLRDEGKRAPLEVRRDLRRLDYLVDPVAEGARPVDALYSLMQPRPDLLWDLQRAPPRAPRFAAEAAGRLTKNNGSRSALATAETVARVEAGAPEDDHRDLARATYDSHSRPSAATNIHRSETDIPSLAAVIPHTCRNRNHTRQNGFADPAERMGEAPHAPLYVDPRYRAHVPRVVQRRRVCAHVPTRHAAVRARRAPVGRRIARR